MKRPSFLKLAVLFAWLAWPCGGVSQTTAGYSDSTVKITSPVPGSVVGNTGEFKINLSALNGNCRLDIYNSAGQLVFTEKLKSTVGSVNIKHMVKGVYTVRLFENDQLRQEGTVTLE